MNVFARFKPRGLLDVEYRNGSGAVAYVWRYGKPGLYFHISPRVRGEARADIRIVDIDWSRGAYIAVWNTRYAPVLITLYRMAETAKLAYQYTIFVASIWGVADTQLGRAVSWRDFKFVDSIKRWFRHE